MTKLLAVRVKDENVRKLYELAAKEHRNPGQQLDVILEEAFAVVPEVAKAVADRA